MTNGSNDKPSSDKSQESLLEIPRLPDGRFDILHPSFYQALSDQLFINTGLRVPVSVIRQRFYLAVRELLLGENSPIWE